MFSKKGISAVVAIVLLILITVAGVGIIYGGILPMFNNIVKPSENAVSIGTTGGYTLYDDGSRIACVQVMREGSGMMTGLRFIFSINGSSHSKEVTGADIPELNQKKTYCFNLSSYGKPDKITVVPLPEGRGNAVTALMPIRRLVTIIEPQDLIKLDGDKDPYEGWIALSECDTLRQEGGKYYLTQDVPASGNCFLVSGNDITFDLNGKTVTGDGSGAGIYDSWEAIDIKNFRIMNGVVKDFGYGFYAQYSPIYNLIVEGVSFNENNIYGFNLYGSALTTIKNSNFNNNDGGGFFISDFGPSLSLENVEANNNLRAGFEVYGQGPLSMNGLEARNNGGSGINFRENTIVSSMEGVISCGNAQDIYCGPNCYVQSSSNVACGITGTFCDNLGTEQGITCSACI